MAGRRRTRRGTRVTRGIGTPCGRAAAEPGDLGHDGADSAARLASCAATRASAASGVRVRCSAVRGDGAVESRPPDRSLASPRAPTPVATGARWRPPPGPGQPGAPVTPRQADGIQAGRGAEDEGQLDGLAIDQSSSSSCSSPPSRRRRDEREAVLARARPRRRPRPRPPSAAAAWPAAASRLREVGPQRRRRGRVRGHLRRRRRSGSRPGWRTGSVSWRSCSRSACGPCSLELELAPASTGP